MPECRLVTHEGGIVSWGQLHLGLSVP